MIRLLVVDDQKVIRESLLSMLRSAPDINVVGTANDGSMALEQAEILKPDVVLLDLEMPGLDGLSASKSISKQFPEIKILFLSSHDSNQEILKALQAGAMGYLLKNTPAQQLQEAIRFVHLGYAQFGPGVIDKVIPLQSKAAVPIQELPRSEANSTAKTASVGAHHPSGHQNPVDSLFFDPIRTPLAASSDHALETLPVQAKTSKTVLYANREVAKETEPESGGLHKIHWRWYLIFGLLCNGLIWGAGLAYLLLTKPVYTSEWTVSLPSSSSSTNVSLPDVGEARSDSDSPYQSNISDPRENYKFLMGSEAVLDLASTQLKVSKDVLNSPDVTILANTTLLQFAVEGASDREAQQTAIAFRDALVDRIQTLRQEEVDQQERSLQKAFDAAKQKLDAAQIKLVKFMAQSGLGSNEPIQDLTSNIEILRRQKSETSAKLQEVEASSRQLAQGLNLTPQQASDAVALKANPIFQQYLNTYNQTSTELISLTSQLSDSHPSVIDQREKQRSAQAKLRSQAQSFLGRPIALAELSRLGLENTSGSSERSELFQQLIRLQGEAKGLSAQSQGLTQQISLLETRLASLTQKASRLTTLQRDAQRAEAVYSSTATRLDLSNANISASYPPISEVSPPSLPEDPSSPKVKFSLAGMLLSSIFISFGLLLLFWRGRQVSKQEKIVSHQSSLRLWKLLDS